MSRPSIIEIMESSRRRKSGIDWTWSKVRELLKERGNFAVADLQALIGGGQTPETTRGWLKSWVLAGYLEARSAGMCVAYVEGPRKTHATPRVRRDGTVLPEPGQERLWRAMKMLGTFTAHDIAAGSAAEDASPVPVTTARRYIGHLMGVGVLAPVGRSTGPDAQWRLVRNLGGAAPKILQTKAIYDPNAKKILGAPKVREVAP